MRIATYNVWNSDAGMPARFGQITNEIRKVGADIFCLQELSEREKHDKIAELYAYSYWQKRTGLSVMSKFPIQNVFEDDFSVFACMTVEGKSVLTANVHLPWDKASKREQSIVKIVKRMSEIKADYAFLTGDFNCSENSSVHRFLTNEQSLSGADAYFFDLAEVFSEKNNGNPPATLNFRENPRWGVVEPKNTLEINRRFDWIMLKNPYPTAMPTIKDCMLFGTEVSAKTGLAASDHYGVWAEIQF